MTFVLDSDPRYRPTSVWFHLAYFGADTTFRAHGEQWVATIPRPPVNRLEYLVVLRYADGSEAMLPDPSNPTRVRGVFGDHSLLHWREYTPPWWLAVADAAEKQAQRDALESAAAARGSLRTGPGVVRERRLGEVPPASAAPSAADAATPLRPGVSIEISPGNPPVSVRNPQSAGKEGVASVRVNRVSLRPGDERLQRSVEAMPKPGGTLVEHATRPNVVVDVNAEVAVTGQLHVPADSVPAEALPLIVVHDGPEYADLAEILRYLSTLARIEPRLRARVLLLQPVDRDRSYSASPAYARALVKKMLPEVRATVNTVRPLVCVGASLGGLSLMHAAVTYPGTFGGLLSQSGSFFLPRFDGQERGYRFYQRIVRFVDSVDADPSRLRGMHVAITCGTGEENLSNNRSMARRLRRIGVPTAMFENPDGHNYTGWRDSMDPALRQLIKAVWLATGNEPS